ncbi:MAG: baseplate J/gp47 family protein [Clostridia bacterium]|nr:baseplate J/gp47 family protein [Clostridia bacterium]
MSYFAPYLDASGLHLPAYTDRLEALCDAYRAIFGQDAALNPAVPDYQLLSVFAKALDDVSALLLQVYLSRNPAYASGQALDLLLPLYGISRRGATCSAVTLTLHGTAGTVIPAGTAVTDTQGRLWKTSEAVTLTGSEAGDAVRAVCDTPGPVYAAAGTVTGILTPIAGWTSVTNPSGSSVGLAEETDAGARARIASALSAGSGISADSLSAALSAVPNVRGCSVCVNDTGAADARGIPAHAVACVVYGGSPAALAKAIYAHKAPGIPTYGSTSVPFEDEAGISHTVSFSRPGTRLVYFMVSLTALPGFDEAAVRAAVSSVIQETVAAVPIGGSLNIPSMFGRCYAAAGSRASAFVLKQIEASSAATSGSPAIVTTELMTQAWNERMALPASGGVQFTIR